MQIVDRSGWGAKPPKSFTPLPPNTLRGVCVHYFGKPVAAKFHSGCPALLRSVQQDHLNHPTENYSDIAYNHAVCPHGVCYELRGFGRRAGANGTREANRDYAAVVYMGGVGDVPTEKTLQGLRFVIGEWREKGAGRKVITHGSITGSSCPGPELGLWVARGGFEYPPVPPDDPKRLRALLDWIAARRREGWSWQRIKRTRNWAEFKRRGGK